MPSLWCKLSIILDEINIQQSAFSFDSWLKRTRGHSLSLKIVCLKCSCTSLRPLLEPYTHQISSLDITIGIPVEYKIVLNDLPALQELHVNIRESFGIPRYTILPYISPHISRLPTLRTLEFTGYFDSLPALNPIWAHLSNLTVDSCEQGAAMRLFHLTPALSSLKITSLFAYEYPALSSLKRISPSTYEFHLEPLTHTSIQSLSVLGRRPRTYSGWRLQNPVVTFLNALTLPNLRVLNVGARSWTGEELKGVGSGSVGMAIDIGAAVEFEDCYERDQ